MKDNLLEVTDLYISFNKKGRTINAVDGISFSIKRGEILGIAGESGCGKTLTALSITGLLPQKAKITGGEIKYKDLYLTSVKNKSINEKEFNKVRGREISIIFQEYRQSLNPLIRVGKQITETLKLFGINKEEYKKRAEEILYRLGFNEPENICNLYPHQLSGGMCQRIMTAIALISRPGLLIADEPSTALDSQSQDCMFSLFNEINRDYGTSILIISHDLSVIKKLCSRYSIMYCGKILEEGPSHTLFSPVHPYTKALAGAIPNGSKKGKDLLTIPPSNHYAEDNLKGCPFAPRCIKAQMKCFEIFPSANYGIKDRVFHCYFPEQGDADG